MAARAFQPAESRFSASTDTPQCPCLESLPGHAWMHLLVLASIKSLGTVVTAASGSRAQATRLRPCSLVWQRGLGRTQPLDQSGRGLCFLQLWRGTWGELPLGALVPLSVPRGRFWNFLERLEALVSTQLPLGAWHGWHESIGGVSGRLTLSVVLTEHECAA